MELLSFAAAILLTILGYSVGAVLAGARPTPPKLGISDLALLAVLCAMSVVLRSSLTGWVALPAGVAVAGVVGALAVRTMRCAVPVPEGAKVASERETSGAVRWKAFLVDVGNYQGRVVLAFFYFVVLGPFALMSRLSGDRLGRTRPVAPSHWLPRETSADSLDAARRQF